MSVLSVVRDVCMVIGVNPPISMFAATIDLRTQAELLALANEMAQRIAYDVREWTKLKVVNVFTGPGTEVDAFNSSHFPMPANFQRMLLTAQVYPSVSPSQPLSYISDSDKWLQNRMLNYVGSWGEWTLLGDEMLVNPAVPPGQTLGFLYLDKNCIKLNGGGYGDVFQNDLDEFRLPERLLKLGMIWQWKANKGSPYAEDMGTYTDALFMLAGSDKPAPIIIDAPPRQLPGGVNALIG